MPGGSTSPPSGTERSRQMTNFNEGSYDVIWFPSDMKRVPKNPPNVVALTFFP